MATYYYAAYFNTPMDQSPISISSQYPLGISPHAIDLPVTPAKISRQDSVISSSPPQNLPKNKNKTLHPHNQSPLFKLPAELRNKIYELLLCPNALSLNQMKKLDSIPPTPPLHPSILTTCRRAHAEAISLLYSTSVFHAHASLLTSLPHLHWPSRPLLYPNAIARIRRWQICLRLDTDPRFTAEQATQAFSGAEFLEIRVWQSMFGGADESVLRLFTGVRGVKVAKVVGVGVELKEWLERKMMEDVVEEDEDKRCRCREGERKLVCENCGIYVKDDGLGEGDIKEWFAGETRDAWTFGNR